MKPPETAAPASTKVLTDAEAGLKDIGSDLGGSAGLEPLRRNGGPTKTHALRRSSRAIDKGPPDAPRKDQRGVRRRDPDIGSFERQVFRPVSPDVSRR